MLERVRAVGVPTPCVYACDATRDRVPFAWQALERIPAPDLNHWFKLGGFDVPKVAFDIGAAVARWQQIVLPGFGVLDESLQGCHAKYEDYFCLRLDAHLAFLVSRGFLAQQQSDEILAEIERHRALLDLKTGCLVHKDLALWNILGKTDRIAAFIDFDDAISGDPWMISHCSPAFMVTLFCGVPLRAIRVCADCRKITCGAFGCICCAT